MARVLFILGAMEGAKVKNNGRVVTLQEASKITGLKVSTLRMRIKSGKLAGFKIATKNGEAWAVKADCISDLSQGFHERLNSMQGSTFEGAKLQGANLQGELVNPAVEAQREHIATLKNTLQNYEALLTTFQARVSNLEVEKQILGEQLRLLPAPAETIPSLIAELEARTLALQADLDRERRRSWWQRLWRR